jgi:uncharacterized protein YcaQ
VAPEGRPALSVTAAQAAAFRLARHHLLGPSAKNEAPTTLEALCHDTGGIQAQVMSAAEMALWTRRRETTSAEIKDALWRRRDIVRTSAMRLTLHLIPARDLSIYITALRSMAAAILRRSQTRVGATPAHVAAMIDAVLAAMDDQPRTQQELIAAARAKAGRSMRAWLRGMGIPVRPAVIEGLIVYGPPRGAEATFVRVDTWLPKQKAIGVDEARAELLRRFLSAYGPATAHDFAKWSGLKMSDARITWSALEGELVRVSVDEASGWIRRADGDRLASSALDATEVRLLGAFDPFLLAHATKEHLVAPKFYKRVYRPQGWISPVVLQGGAIVGVWFPTSERTEPALDVQLFSRGTPVLREGLAREAEAMGRLLGTRCRVRIRTV